jgi:hypothetical protein
MGCASFEDSVAGIECVHDKFSNHRPQAANPRGDKGESGAAAIPGHVLRVAELARVQNGCDELNSGEFSYRQKSLPHPMNPESRPRLASTRATNSHYDMTMNSARNTISAGQFKARCLSLIDHVANSGETLVIFGQ